MRETSGLPCAGIDKDPQSKLARQSTDRQALIHHALANKNYSYGPSFAVALWHSWHNKYFATKPKSQSSRSARLWLASSMPQYGLTSNSHANPAHSIAKYRHIRCTLLIEMHHHHAIEFIFSDLLLPTHTQALQDGVDGIGMRHHQGVFTRFAQLLPQYK